MKTKAIMAALLMAVAAFAFAVPADSGDATITSMSIEGGTNLHVDKGKPFTFTLNYFADRNDTITASVYDVSSPSNPVWSDKVSLIVNDAGKIDVSMQYDKNASQVHMKITFMSGSTKAYDDIYFDITYNTSLWDNWAVYGVIILLIVAVLAFVLFKSRSAPKEKNKLTFEQIEAEKNAEKAAPAPEKKKAPAVKSERQRYLDSKRKKE